VDARSRCVTVSTRRLELERHIESRQTEIVERLDCDVTSCRLSLASYHGIDRQSVSQSCDVSTNCYTVHAVAVQNGAVRPTVSKTVHACQYICSTIASSRRAVTRPCWTLQTAPEVPAHRGIVWCFGWSTGDEIYSPLLHSRFLHSVRPTDRPRLTFVLWRVSLDWTSIARRLSEPVTGK